MSGPAPKSTNVGVFISETILSSIEVRCVLLNIAAHGETGMPISFVSKLKKVGAGINVSLSKIW